LHAIQDEHSYVPRESALVLSAEAWHTFSPNLRGYSLFIITFRTVAARGAQRSLSAMARAAGLNGSTAVLAKPVAQTAHAGRNPLVKVSEVRCVGCCALAPLAFADKNIYTHLDTARTADMLAALRPQRAPR
jgi:NADH:ubiquinone oxidoreductase subunit E